MNTNRFHIAATIEDANRAMEASEHLAMYAECSGGILLADARLKLPLVTDFAPLPYNPRYVAFAASQGRTPEQQIAHDGDSMVSFLTWEMN